MSELVPLRVEKHFKPLPQNKTLAPLRGSFIKESPPPSSDRVNLIHLFI